MHKARVWRPALSSDMSGAVLWVFKAQALTTPCFVYEITPMFEWKWQPDKSHVTLNQWPVLRRHNCLFTAGYKSILAFPPLVHPYKCYADSGCLAAAVLKLFLLFFWLMGNKVSSFFTILVKDSAKTVKDVFHLRGTESAGWWNYEFLHRCRTL